MIDYIIGIIIGFTACLVLRPQGKDEQEQQRIYDERYEKYQEEIKYYKSLCKWHVDQKRANFKDFLHK